MSVDKYKEMYENVGEIKFKEIAQGIEINITSSLFDKNEFNVGIVSIPQKNKDYLKHFLIEPHNEGYINQVWENCVNAFNKCVKSNVDIILFPEHSISMKNLPYIIKKAVSNNIIVIGGIVPQIHNDQVINQLVTIIPYDYGFEKNYKDAFVYFRDKVYFAPEELETINKCKKRYYSREGNSDKIVLFNINNKLKMVNYNCFELYDYTCRNKYNGYSNFITASVNNPDLDSFKNILYSLRIDAFSYVAQSNYSNYGDCMLIAPKKSYMKDIMNIKGSDNVEVVVAKMDLKDLENAKLHESNRKDGNYKPLPPHFDKIINNGGNNARF